MLPGGTTDGPTANGPAVDSPAVPPTLEEQQTSDAQECARAMTICDPSRDRDALPKFLTRYVQTLDEDGTVAHIPAYDYVLEDARSFMRREDSHDEKTRQMMLSWLSAGSHLWACMFERNASGFLGSRKERLVDDGGFRSTPNSLMGRMRYIYDHLPPLIRMARPVEFTHLKVRCDVTGSFVVGEATNPDMARGGTYGRADIDEAAMLSGTAWYRAVRSACRTGLRLRSTPNGKANVFAQVKFETPGNFKFHRYHWTRHPARRMGLYWAKNKPRSPWYDGFTASMTVDDIAREIDISYEHSVSGQIWPEYDEDVHLSWDVVYDPALPLYVGMDFGAAAATTAIFFQIHGREMWVLADYESWNGDVDDHAPAIWAIAERIGFQGTRADLIIYGDPAGNARELTNKNSTVIRAYRSHGFLQMQAAPRRTQKDSYRLVRRKFVRNEIRIHMECRHLRKRIPDLRYRTDDMGYVISDTVYENQSLHICDAFRYGAHSKFPIDEDYITLLSVPLDESSAPKTQTSADGPMATLEQKLAHPMHSSLRTISGDMRDQIW